MPPVNGVRLCNEAIWYEVAIRGECPARGRRVEDDGRSGVGYRAEEERSNAVRGHTLACWL